MVEAAVAQPTAALKPAQIAARHGLTKAGARPSIGRYTRQLWQYRHFITSYAGAQSSAVYKSTVLGQFWRVVTPMVNAAIYFVVFGIVLNTKDRVDNFLAYLCIGVFLFGFTQEVAIAGIKSIGDNLNLIRALKFPRAALPISASLTHLPQMAVSLLVLMGIVVGTKEPVTTGWLLVIPALLLMIVFNAGLGMILARLGSRVRDLKQMIPFILRTWLYASGVFYGVDRIITNLDAPFNTIFAANPMLIYIELVRHALLGSELVGFSNTVTWSLAVAWAAVVGVAGYVIVWQGEGGYGRG